MTTTPNYVRQFDTFTDFVNAAEAPADKGYTGTRRSRDTTMGSWYGSRSWDAALRVARDGWPDGRAAVERVAVKISGIVQSSIPMERMVSAVAGGTLDVGTYLSGDPECFYVPEQDDTARMRQGRGPIVRIVANLCASAGVSTTTITRRGAAVVALADALDKCGYRSEVIGTWVTDNRRAAVVVTAVIKRPDQSVQVDQLAFALAHPSAFRRLAFSIFEQAPANVREPLRIVSGGGYGKAADVDPAYIGGAADITLPAADMYSRAEWADDETAAQWVREALEAQGVTLEEAS